MSREAEAGAAAGGALGLFEHAGVLGRFKAGAAREALACLETAQAMGFIGAVEPELGALFQRVIGTLERLVETRRGRY